MRNIRLIITVALLVLATSLAAFGQSFECRIGLLDEAVGRSDGVTFMVRLLDTRGKPLATLLERKRFSRGWLFVRRDLSRFAGQDVILQLEVSPGKAMSAGWDWAVWYRPVVKDSDGNVVLDAVSRIDECEAGCILDGHETIIGKGPQCNLDGANHGATVWAGKSLPQKHPTVKDAVFVVDGKSTLGDVLFTHPAYTDGVGSVFARFRLKVPQSREGSMKVNDEEYEYPRHIAGYRGDLEDIESVADSVPAQVEPVARSTSPADISLTDMAASAMHYLIHNPLPAHNYECRFDIDLLAYPPSMRPGTRDPYITFGDTESRMDLQFIYMREMSGSEQGREAEDAIRKRIMGYVRDDGLCWVPPYCINCNLSDHEPCALSWTTGYTLMTLVERYVRDGDERDIALAKKLVGGLESLASWDTGRAYYAGGMGGWRDGDWMYTGCSDSYPCILEPICRYIEVTGDREALEFAEAFADGMLSDLQSNLGANRILEDGSFGGYNCHLHMRAVLGVAHLGVLTHNTRYIEWARRAYEWLKTQGTDWGWFPESPGRGNSETCATGDMTDLAGWLAKAGYSRYWDDLERFVRNYIRESQFFVTPEYKVLYGKVHKDNPEQADEGIRQAHDFEGGFVARLLPNSLAIGSSMNMMGCCPPSGMKALHIAWRNVVTESPDGVFVNICFNRDARQARVVSFAPEIGRMTVVVKQAGHFFLRPPSWAPRGAVRAYRGSKQVEAVWKGDYVKFSDAAVGEELTITYPVMRFKQTVEVAGKTYTYDWLGNTVVSVSPPGEGLALFSDVPRPLSEILGEQ